MKPPWKQKRKSGVTAWSNVPVAGTRMDVSIRFPSSDLASLDKVHRWRPCPLEIAVETNQNLGNRGGQTRCRYRRKWKNGGLFDFKNLWQSVVACPLRT